MEDTIYILYIHGMGGGGDSRIPSILREHINERTDAPCARLEVVVRTYNFDPVIAAGQIEQWVRELRPALIVGESLGALQAIRIKGLPHILVSPSLNAPLYLGYLAFLALVPGMTALLDRIYRPKPGDRQPLHFSFSVLRKYRLHRKLALSNSTRAGSGDFFFAFFGARDHYRRSGIVSVRTWRKYFGGEDGKMPSYQMYDGTHFMEEEFVRTLLIDRIYSLIRMPGRESTSFLDRR